MICYGKPALIDRLPPFHGVVQASAGTGKTFTLERMVVDFLLTGTPLEQILVVTFTDKAALELRARIRKMLETLVNLAETPADAQAPLWTLGATELALLQAAQLSFDRATIATIHGFCRKILVESAFEGGALLSQELADGKKLFTRAFRDCLRLRFKDTPGAWPLFLEALQSMTVEQVGELLLEASQDRGLQLPPYRDLTADLAAFDPAWLADPQALGQAMAAAKVPAGSRNAALERLPGLARLLDRTRSPFTFLGACDVEPLRKACLKLPGGPGLELGLWLDQVAPARHGLTDKALLVHALLPPVKARVRALKNAEGLFDHDDTILQVKAALASPTAQALLERIGAQYRIALIDEFQDTDQAQWEIFHRLFTGEGQRFYVIGDPKQAIYGFRGGDLPTYDAAVKLLLGGAEPLELTSNFRSTPRMIEACNDLFTGGEGDQRFFQNADTYPADKAVQCGNPALRATTADGQDLAPVRILVTQRFEGRGAGETLADALAGEIKDTVSQGVVLLDPQARNPEDRSRTLHFGDVQVLVGTTREGRLMAKALARMGVPSTFFKQKGLLASEEAKDLLDVLRAVERPLDPGRRARALLTPFFGHRLQDLDRLGTLPDDHPAVQRLQHWRDLGAQRQFHLLLESMLTDSGLILRLRLRTGSERALTNHLHLAELLSSSARHHAADLEALVRRLDQWVRGEELPAGEDTDLQRVEGQDRTVQILTLHASKGLEAGIVALFANSRGRTNPALHRFHLPDGQRAYSIGSAKDGPFEALIKAEEASEQERLMYVGLTRAKALLLLPCALVPPGSRRPAHPLSAYKVVNRRLKPLAEAGQASSERYRILRPDLPEQRDRATEALALPDWEMPVLPALATPDYATARQQARPSFTTSYTHLERVLKQQAPSAETYLADREPDAPDAPSASDALPRGSQTGLAIHELIEAEDCAEAMAQPFPLWWSSPARKDRVRHKLAEHGLEPRWDEKAARMVQAALTVPLPARDGSAAPLGVHELLLREVAFLSRYQETGDFLEGYMDAVYVRDGLTYFLDWKTNTVPPYSPEALAAFYEEHFAIQAKIYTLVLLDHLRLDDEAAYEQGFGGLHYVFLRAAPPALHSLRPTWTTIQAWRQDLQALHTKVAHV